MSKTKFRYNPSTLEYEKIEKDWRRNLLRFTSVIILSIFFGILIHLGATQLIDSPKERLLKQENNQLKAQYQILDKRMDQVSAVMEEIERRDDEIYRVIFEAEPIPDNIRQAGFGGVNRYQHLEDMRNSEMLVAINKKLDKISKSLYIQSKSYDEVYKLAINKEKMLASIPAIQPVANVDLKRMASGYGVRMHPIYKTLKMHTGMDFTASTGTEIYATGNGKVVHLEKSRRGYGFHIIIDHGYGFKTLYAHMSKFNVRRGEKVKRGQVIGYVGNTGGSTGPHLHYEVIKNGDKVNPINYYFNDLSPEEFEAMVDLASRPTQSFD